LLSQQQGLCGLILFLNILGRKLLVLIALLGEAFLHSLFLLKDFLSLIASLKCDEW